MAVICTDRGRVGKISVATATAFRAAEEEELEKVLIKRKTNQAPDIRPEYGTQFFYMSRIVLRPLR